MPDIYRHLCLLIEKTVSKLSILGSEQGIKSKAYVLETTHFYRNNKCLKYGCFVLFSSLLFFL